MAITSITGIVSNTDDVDSDYKVEDVASELVEKYAESFDRKNWIPADDFRKMMFDYVAKQ
jgi:hypothetical protein